MSTPYEMSTYYHVQMGDTHINVESIAEVADLIRNTPFSVVTEYSSENFSRTREAVYSPRHPAVECRKFPEFLELIGTGSKARAA